ncbi:hypothetical protein [Sphingomonas sp. ID0503]|uniref:hypothetical protein n=1 Tax=Sphingomonas sp. ID0503 TaxID=3399691 RepID=UPI003AFB2213
MGHSVETANFLMASRLRDAARGSTDALYQLGIAYSSGSDGVDLDLIQAHKWFNLAAVRGHEEAADYRTEIADEMTAREIVEAQKQARAWLGMTARRVA